ncbi:MAG: M13 family metallopeptidase [Verrucomicrobia bacterium]|nr:M13 family metallopeptidase [Verrucomicrobiota bacterium]
MKLPLRLLALSFAAALPFGAHAGTTALPLPAGPIKGVDRAYIDPAVSPCKDFYDYANGAFNKVAIPGEYSNWGVNEEINERNYAILKGILESSARTSGPQGSIAQRVGDFYAAGMDEATIEKDGLTSLAPYVDEIHAIKSGRDIIPTLGKLFAQGVDAGFGFGTQIDDKDTTVMIASFAQGGLGLPERDYYFREGPEAADIRTAYVAHIARMFELAGSPADVAKANAATVMAFETKLAKVSRTLVERRDPEKNYHKYARSALAKVAPGLEWESFFRAIGLPASEKYVLIGQPEFFAAFAGLLDSEPVETWRVYLRWHLLHQSAGFLRQAFVDENFAFYGKKLSGKTELRPRWKRVLAAADNAIGEDLGQLYVKQAFSPAAKERALTMVKFHLEAMRNRIKAADWMSETTKLQAYKKIDAMRSKVGYPDVWRDYSSLTITRTSYVQNAIAASAFEFRRNLNKLGKPVDRSEWLMTPQTNNAYYEPTLNEMCFPAGILQPPFFDENADDATNYGALASTIGHELTHGFDDQGRQYDAQGNLKSWWTEDDAKKFEVRAELVAKQYSAYQPLPGLHIDGHQTLGENIADVGGLRVSYEAFKLATANKRLMPVDGFTPDQRFFIAFAQGWRTNQRPEQLRLQVTSDVHSPVHWRVVGPVANFPEFRAAFDCKEPAPSWPPIW